MKDKNNIKLPHLQPHTGKRITVWYPALRHLTIFETHYFESKKKKKKKVKSWKSFNFLMRTLTAFMCVYLWLFGIIFRRRAEKKKQNYEQNNNYIKSKAMNNAIRLVNGQYDNNIHNNYCWYELSSIFIYILMDIKYVSMGWLGSGKHEICFVFRVFITRFSLKFRFFFLLLFLLFHFQSFMFRGSHHLIWMSM